MTNVQRTQGADGVGGLLPPLMRAVQSARYGGPDALSLEAVPTPAVRAGEVIVRVCALSLNPADVHQLRGEPFVARSSTGWHRPRTSGFGGDFAGLVVAVGEGVDGVHVGERVAGRAPGACAEYVSVAADRMAGIPTEVSMAEAACLPIAASTAFQAVIDHAQLRHGQRLLINGAAGGVGSFAVQIAATEGLEVTGVCARRNADFVRGLGATHIVDYAETNWIDEPDRYDAIIDMVGNHPPRRARRALSAAGVYVMVGAPITHPWTDPFPRLLAGKIGYAGSSPLSVGHRGSPPAMRSILRR